MQTIELDCAPGATRPWDLIAGVVDGIELIKLTEDDLKPHAFFGQQQWSFDIPRDVWEREVQPVIIPRITALYNSGRIRYGGW